MYDRRHSGIAVCSHEKVQCRAGKTGNLGGLFARARINFSVFTLVMITHRLLSQISSNLNATILKFSEKFDHSFSHVFKFGNMFRESHSFVAVPVTRSNNTISLH